MGITLQTLKNRIRQTLDAVTDTPQQARAETLYILEYILNVDEVTALSDPGREILAAQEERVRDLLRRRTEQRIPIQYLVSKGFFYGLTLHVTPDVLIPRPETELLVDKALDLSESRGYRRFLDIGTGSGAIALALASRVHEDGQIVATDVSARALAVAERNARDLGLSERIAFREGSLFEPVQGETFDVVASNPPYIDPALRESLAPEVREHEPALALFSEDPLFFYREIAGHVRQYLNPGGVVVLELGAGLADAAREYFTAAGFSDVTVEPDYAGIDRVLTAGL